MLLSPDLIARALPGLVTTTDAAEELREALEALCAQRRPHLTRAEAESAVIVYRSKAAAARALGVPRSTLRDALRGVA